jgi:pyridoxine 4-dehydrogenase
MGIEEAGSFSIGGDLPVIRLGYGAMRLCGPGVWGRPADAGAAEAVLTRALELGVTLIDTADAYGPEVNEGQIYDALAPYPAGVTIATKGGLVRGAPNDWSSDGRPAHLDRAINNSLRRLGVDTIDLYQLHAPDDDVPYADSIGALARAREDGRIRHIGVSNVNIDELEIARGIAPIVSVQNRYNLGHRDSQDVLDHCERHGIGFIPWYPLAAAALSSHDASSGTANQRALSDIAQAHGATTSQIALAWLLHKSPVMLPIPGTSSVAHLEENIGAAGISLSSEEQAALDAFAR